MNKELELREIKTILRYIVENKTDKDHYTIRGLETIKKALDYIENSIPKQLVEEKIEELKKQSGGNVFHIQQTINAKIRLLEELLEGK